MCPFESFRKSDRMELLPLVFVLSRVVEANDKLRVDLALEFGVGQAARVAVDEGVCRMAPSSRA